MNSVIKDFIGLKDDLSEDLKTKIIIVCSVACLSVGYTIVYGILFYSMGFYWEAQTMIFVTIGFVYSIYLSSKGKYEQSKFAYLFSSCSSILVFSVTLGMSSGFHLFNITAPTYAFCCYKISQRKEIFLTIFAYVVCYIIIAIVHIYKEGYTKHITVYSVIFFSAILVQTIMLTIKNRKK